jgi:hypothetical protein
MSRSINNVTMDKIKPIIARGTNNTVENKAKPNKSIKMISIAKPGPTMTMHKVKGTIKSPHKNVAMPTTSAMIDIILGLCFSFLSSSLIFQTL